MKKRLPIGVSNFRKMIEEDLYFVDKSLFIKELLEDGSEIILLTRPRRFGKTLNMSMIRNFFEKTDEDKRYLFEGLKVWNYEEVREHFGKYPVIYITFKDEKYLTWEDCKKGFSMLIRELYKKYEYILEGTQLSKTDQEDYCRILEANHDIMECVKSLNLLSFLLSKYHKSKVILLIDEYDVPIQSGYLNGYYDEVINFMRNFLSGGLKDNDNLYKAVLTGILRIAKESIFSGLNNLNVCTILSSKYSKHFGFTEIEVEEMLNYYCIETKMGDVKRWYNGYIFGEEVIYNPWSIIKYIENVNDGLKAHWNNTSSNDFVKHLVTKGGEKLKEELQALMQGEALEKYINEDIVMSEVELDSENIWMFLFFSGYLKVIRKERDEDGELKCWLTIPNIEVRSLYRAIILGWFKVNLGMDKYRDMLRALINGEIDVFSDIFSDFVLNSISYFDVSGKESEKVYHAFVLGMLISLNETHEVKSNRESGYGRYDVMVIPKDKNALGIIIEFKKVIERKKETLETACKKALEQIEEKRYEIEMKDRGVKGIVKLGIAFKGKKVLIKF